MQNYAKIANIISKILILTAVMFLLPLLSLPFFGEQSQVHIFVLPALAVGFFGFAVARLTKNASKHVLNLRHSAIAVVIAWLCAIVVSALPFVLFGLPLDIALFESTNGWTTTGATAIVPEDLPRMLLLWRSIMQASGGLGVILVMLLVAPEQTAMMMNAEGHTERIFPNARTTTQAILALYIGYIAIGAVLYALAGMSVFDAINHSMTAISTGGFSTHTNSIGHFGSVAIESVTVFLTLLGSISFGVHLMLISRRWLDVAQMTELRVLPFVLVGGFALVFAGTFSGAYVVSQSVRHSIFDTAAVFSTSGFFVRHADYSYSGLTTATFVCLMLIGGMSGSTTGGVKIIRIIILIKSMFWNLSSSFNSDNTWTKRCVNGLSGRVHYSGEMIKENNAVLTYSFVFCTIGVFIFAFCGFDFGQSLFFAVGTVTNTGFMLSFDIGALPRMLLALLMFFGRLEFVIVLVAIGQLVKDSLRIN